MTKIITRSLYVPVNSYRKPTDVYAFESKIYTLKIEDKLNYNNYRGISILSTTYKTFSNIIYRRLEKYANKILGKY